MRDSARANWAAISASRQVRPSSPKWEALPQARIYLIDTADDLNRLVEAFPLPLEHRMRRTALDWEGYGKVRSRDERGWVSEDGITANGERLPIYEPSLSRWECSSVLWLRPTYRLTTP